MLLQDCHAVSNAAYCACLQRRGLWYILMEVMPVSGKTRLTRSGDVCFATLNHYFCWSMAYWCPHSRLA